MSYNSDSEPTPPLTRITRSPDRLAVGLAAAVAGVAILVSLFLGSRSDGLDRVTTYGVGALIVLAGAWLGAMGMVTESITLDGGALRVERGLAGFKRVQVYRLGAHASATLSEDGALQIGPTTNRSRAVFLPTADGFVVALAAGAPRRAQEQLASELNEVLQTD